MGAIGFFRLLLTILVALPERRDRPHLARFFRFPLAFVSVLSPEIVERYRQVGLKKFKITIGCKYGDLVVCGEGTDKKIGVGTLNPLTTAKIVIFSSSLIIATRHFKIGKGPQVMAQFLELDMALHTGKEFLAHRSNHPDSHLPNQLS